MINRRNALRLFGSLFVCLAGRVVLAQEKTALQFRDDLDIPSDYIFNEEGMGNIIIERKNGKKIIVPFSDIVDALEGNK